MLYYNNAAGHATGGISFGLNMEMEMSGDPATKKCVDLWSEMIQFKEATSVEVTNAYFLARQADALEYIAASLDALIVRYSLRT